MTPNQFPAFGTTEYFQLHEHLRNKKVLTSREAAFFMGVALNYLYVLNYQKKIESTCPNGGRRYYDREKLEEWMTTNRAKSRASLQRQAANYLVTSKIN